jgi:hypothetical protein
MTGDERVRFCDLCHLNVYDISQFTRNEAASLIANTEGRICARLYRRTDGTIITGDCPVGLRALRQHTAKAAAAIFATLMSLCSTAFGQDPSAKEKSPNKQTITITKKAWDSSSEDGVLSGTIADPGGALIPGAKITVTERQGKTSISTESNLDGQFRLSGLAPAVYDLVIESRGFSKLNVNDVVLGAKQAVDLELLLQVDPESSTMGLMILTEPLVRGTLVINEHMDIRPPRKGGRF